MYSLMGEILSVTAYTFHTLYTNHLCINCRQILKEISNYLHMTGNRKYLSIIAIFYIVYYSLSKATIQKRYGIL